MDRKDEIILQQMDLIRSMTERNLRSMDTDFWGTPLMEKKTNQPPISEKSEKPASQTQAAKPEEKEEIPPKEKIEYPAGPGLPCIQAAPGPKPCPRSAGSFL